MNIGVNILLMLAYYWSIS